MISGGDEDSSEDDEASGAVSQWSLIARAPKVLGVDPVTQLQVHIYSIVDLQIIQHNQVLFYLPTPSALSFSPHWVFPCPCIEKRRP